MNVGARACALAGNRRSAAATCARSTVAARTRHLSKMRATPLNRTLVSAACRRARAVDAPAAVAVLNTLHTARALARLDAMNSNCSRDLEAAASRAQRDARKRRRRGRKHATLHVSDDLAAVRIVDANARLQRKSKISATRLFSHFRLLVELFFRLKIPANVEDCNRIVLLFFFFL